MYRFSKKRPRQKSFRFEKLEKKRLGQKCFLLLSHILLPTFSQVLFSIGFYQEKSIRNKPNKLEIFLLGML